MSAVLEQSQPRVRKKPKEWIAIARTYAKKVVKQKYQCRTMKLVCQQFLDDEKASKKKDFAFYLNDFKAAHVCWFAENLPHTKGELSDLPYPNNLIKLEPFQVFIFVNLFGWVRKDNDLRRYREAYIKIPRKNGKSVIASVIGLYMLAADGEPGSEVYSGASSEKQANEVFKPARMMAVKEARRGFCKRFGIRINVSSLEIPSDGSKFERLVGNPGDGGSPHCALVDEYHEHKNDNLFNTMKTGMLARNNSLMFIITTAGTDISLPCYAYEKDCISDLENRLNDRRFVAIWGVDNDEDWKSLSWLKAANPNFGVSVVADDLLADLEEAKRKPAKQSIFKQKHCNIWTTGENAFFNMEHWSLAADSELNEADFSEDELYTGLDLASAVDIASEVRIYRRIIGVQWHYYIFGNHYVPEAVRDEPDLKAYQDWIDAGHLTATPGNKINHFGIGDNILKWSSRTRFELLGYDGYNADMLVSYLEDGNDDFDGIDIEKLIKVPQQRKYLSDALKFVEAELKEGTIHHNDNHAMNWMMSNVMVRKTDYQHDNYHAIKAVAKNKIDGAVALITGVAVMNSVAEESIDIDNFLDNPVFT